jgi:hypothetical protein
MLEDAQVFSSEPKPEDQDEEEILKRLRALGYVE